MKKKHFLLYSVLLLLFLLTMPVRAKELTLKEAIIIALEKNYSLKNSLENLLDAVSNLRVKSNLANISMDTKLLTGSDSGSQTYLYKEAKLNFLQNIQTGDQLNLVNKDYSSNNYSQRAIYNRLDVEFKKPILRGGGFVSGRYEIDKALRDLSIAELKYFLARQKLITEVAGAYYDIIKGKLLIQVNEEAVKNAEDSLYRATRLLEEQMITKIEKTRAEVQYAKSKNNLVGSIKKWRNAKDRLKILIGLTVVDDIDVIYEIFNKKIEYNEEKLISDALAFHKELEILNLEDGQKKSNLNYAENQLKPEFNLVSTYNILPSENPIGQIAYLNLPTWTVGLEAKYLFRDFSSEENLKSAKRKMPLKKEEIKLKTQELIENVKINLRELNTSYEEIAISQENLNAAQMSLSVSQKRWEEGLDTNRDVIDAQQSLLEAQASLINAKINSILSRIMLEESTGYDLLKFFDIGTGNEN